MEYNTTADSNISGILAPPMDYNSYGDYDIYGEDDIYINPFDIPHIRGIFIFLYSVVFACCFIGEYTIIVNLVKSKQRHEARSFYRSRFISWLRINTLLEKEKERGDLVVFMTKWPQTYLSLLK